MELTVEELNELLEREFERGKNSVKQESTNTIFPQDWIDVVHTQYTPSACRCCPQHPSNGGSGICNCVLPDEIIY